MRRRYTSVLPLPVTPCRSQAAKPGRRLADRGNRRRLRRRECRSRAAGAGGGRSLGSLDRLEPTAARERVQGGAETRGRDDFRRDVAVADHRQQFALARAEPRACGERFASACRQPPENFGASRGRTLAQRFRYRGEQHFAERVVVVVRGPQQQAEGHRVPVRLRVEGREHALQPRARQFAVRRAGRDHADGAAAAERHGDPHARLRRFAGGARQVIEATPERRVKNHLDDARIAAQKNRCFNELCRWTALLLSRRSRRRPTGVRGSRRRR
jgi:hypothetical protein